MSETRETVRLYRYLPAKWALRTLETRELRVSRLAELNDPFEFRPALAFVNPMFSHEVVDEFLGFLVRKFNPKMGIVCFAEEIGDPVLWSHYADSHRGIALAFDVFKDDSLWPMAYPEERPTFDVKNFPTMTTEEAKRMVHRILTAKAPSWRYEREQRVFVDLASSRTEEGHYFHRIPSDCLVQVVLGIACPLKEAAVRMALHTGGLGNVAVVQAKRCLTKFKVLA